MVFSVGIKNMSKQEINILKNAIEKLENRLLRVEKLIYIGYGGAFAGFLALELLVK